MLATAIALLPDNRESADDLLSRPDSEPTQQDTSGSQQSSETCGSRARSPDDKNYLGYRLKGSNCGHCLEAVSIVKFA
jgi:hypothetical protein